MVKADRVLGLTTGVGRSYGGGMHECILGEKRWLTRLSTLSNIQLGPRVVWRVPVSEESIAKFHCNEPLMGGFSRV